VNFFGDNFYTPGCGVQGLVKRVEGLAGKDRTSEKLEAL